MKGSDIYKRAMTLIRSAKLKKVSQTTQDDPTSPTCQPDSIRFDSGRSENCLIMRVSYPVESACKEPSLNLLRLNAWVDSDLTKGKTRVHFKKNDDLFPVTRFRIRRMEGGAVTLCIHFFSRVV